MSPRKFREQEYLKRFSVALHDMPEDDAELVLYMDAYRMYLLGLVRSPEVTFREMQGTFRRAKDIKKRVVSTKDVDLETLVDYFQNDLPALRMALPRCPEGGLPPCDSPGSRSPVDLIEERRWTGKALRKVMTRVQDVLARLAEGSSTLDHAAKEIGRSAFGRLGRPSLIESLAKLHGDKKAWESSLPDGRSEPPPKRSGAEPIPLDDQSPWYPSQIFVLRLIEHMKTKKRPAEVVSQCKRADCTKVFVKSWARDFYCSESCKGKTRKSRKPKSAR